MGYFLRQILCASDAQPIRIPLQNSEVVVGSTYPELAEYRGLSKKHATFFISHEGDIYVKDVNGRNGVFVNNVEIGTALKRLVVGDTIKFGKRDVICFQLCSDDIEIISDKNLQNPINPGALLCIENNGNILKPPKPYEIRKNEVEIIEVDIDSDEPLNVQNPLSKQSASKEKNLNSRKNCIRNSTCDALSVGGDFSSSSAKIDRCKKFKKSQSKTICTRKKRIRPISSDSSEESESSDSLYNVSCKKKRTKLLSSESSDENSELPLASYNDTEFSQDRNEFFSNRVQISENLPSSKESNFLHSPSLNEPASRISFERNENLKFESKDIVLKNCFYSQTEEVIFISDDDSYLDYNSPQMHVGTPTVSEDIEDCENDIYRQIFLDSPLTELCSDTALNNSESHNQEKETIENIRKFLNTGWRISEIPTDNQLETASISHEVSSEILGNQSDNEKRSDSDSYRNEKVLNVKNWTISSSDSDNEGISDSRIGRDNESRPNCNNSENNMYHQSSDIDEYPQCERILYPTVRKNTTGSASNKDTSKVLLTNAKSVIGRSRRMRSSAKRKSKTNKSLFNRGKERKTKRETKIGGKVIDKSWGVQKKISPSTAKKNRNVPITKPGSQNFSENSEIRCDDTEKRKPSVKVRPEKFGSRSQFLTSETELKSSKRSQFTVAPPGKENAKIVKKDKRPHIKPDEPKSLKETVHTAATEDKVNVRSSEEDGSCLTNQSVPGSMKISENATMQKSDINIEKESIQVSTENKFAGQSEPVQNKHPKDMSNSTDISASTSKGPSSAKLKEPIPDTNCTIHKTVDNAETITNSYALSLHSSENIFKTPSSSSTREVNSLPSPFSSFDLLNSILKLKVVWLKEQKTEKYPPAPVTEGIRGLPLIFESYDSYVSHFFPFIKLENWEHMFAESKKIYESNREYNLFYFSIISSYNTNDYKVLKCETVVNDKLFFAPRQGMITILELKENHQTLVPLFAYISNHTVHKLDFDSLKSPAWKKFPDGKLKNAKIWKFYCFIKRRQMSFLDNSLMRGNGVCSIWQKQKHAEALSCIRYSPFLKDILNPRLSTFKFESRNSSPSDEYSSQQLGIIKGICAEVHKTSSKPKIILLDGPPGTGKTHVIVGVLQRMFYTRKCDSNVKVLVTGPSNVALDEIGCRLIEIDKSCAGRINIVRVGPEKQVHEKMLPYSLNRIADKMRERSQWQAEKELNRLYARKFYLEKSMLTQSKRNELKLLKEHCKKKEMDIEKMAGSGEMYQIDVLKESHVIFSSLSSLYVLQRALKSDSDIQISLCIVDESTQCTELDILQALNLGITKLILTGDGNHVPPMVSKQSAKYGLEMSIFERFSFFFESIGETNHKVSLVEQFRMHPLICEFLSKYMYANRLLTHKDRTYMYKDFQFKPLVVLDFTETSSFRIQDNLYSICKFMLQVAYSESSIGIIVPSESDLSVGAKYLRSLNRHKKIEIGTLASFQGREKDIIILYTSETKADTDEDSFITCPRRLNVALTRAKKCLIICVRCTSVKHLAHWKALIGYAQGKELCYPVASEKDLSKTLRSCRR